MISSNQRITRKQVREGDWQFDATMRNCGSNIEWVVQRDAKTGFKRWVRPTNSAWGDATSGKVITRYNVPRN